MITVSIIIPVYNRINITKQGLSSLTDSLNHCKGGCVNVKFEIIVVDEAQRMAAVIGLSEIILLYMSFMGMVICGGLGASTEVLNTL